MAGEEARIKPNAPGARLDHPDDGVIGEALGANPTAFGNRPELNLCSINDSSAGLQPGWDGDAERLSLMVQRLLSPPAGCR